MDDHCFPSAAAHTWGRTAVPLLAGYCQGTPFARGILRKSSLLLEKQKPESKPENQGSIFSLQSLFSYTPDTKFFCPDKFQDKTVAAGDGIDTEL